MDNNNIPDKISYGYTHDLARMPNRWTAICGDAVEEAKLDQPAWRPYYIIRKREAFNVCGIIDNCGRTSVVRVTQKFMLISVCDREILTEIFPTLAEAQDMMHEEMCQWGRVPKEIFLEKEYDDGNCGFGEWSGYANDGNNHANYDWLIVEL